MIYYVGTWHRLQTGHQATIWPVLFGPIRSLGLGPGPLLNLFGRSYSKILSFGRSSVGPQVSNQIRSRSRASGKTKKTGTETDPGPTETGTVHHCPWGPAVPLCMIFMEVRTSETGSEIDSLSCVGNEVTPLQYQSRLGLQLWGCALGPGSALCCIFGNLMWLWFKFKWLSLRFILRSHQSNFPHNKYFLYLCFFPK